MLRELGITKVQYANNPRKVKLLEDYGIQVPERVEHIATNQHNERYLAVKAEKSGHLF